ncbi:hypothetical protein [Dankookia sp. P2]|uniref:hypothetical protein n=1 Tax=Dankookia sp. P2 TaxID=3423955 RepID=UPI003D676029
MLETVHVEPGDDWESLRLICGLGGSENRTSVSALAGSRLRAALGTYLSVVDLNDPDGEWAD